MFLSIRTVGQVFNQDRLDELRSLVSKEDMEALETGIAWVKKATVIRWLLRPFWLRAELSKVMNLPVDDPAHFCRDDGLGELRMAGGSKLKYAEGLLETFQAQVKELKTLWGPDGDSVPGALQQAAREVVGFNRVRAHVKTLKEAGMPTPPRTRGVVSRRAVRPFE